MADTVEIAIYRAFYDFIQVCVPNTTVRLLDSNVVAPDGPYVGVKVDAINPISWTRGFETLPDDVDGITTSFSTYDATILFIAYGDNSMGRLQAIASGLRERQTKKVLKDNGIAYRDSSGVIDASSPIDGTKIEKRATMTVNAYFVQGGDDRGGGGDGVIEQATFLPTYNEC